MERLSWIRIRDSQRGMVMPMVIVFVIVSQLIYWGLLRINQWNVERYQTYQAYYQSRIQEEIARQHYDDNYLNLAASFEADIESLIQADLASASLYSTEEWIEQSLNQGIARVEGPFGQPSLWLYSYDLYVMPEAVDYLDGLQELRISGTLDASNLPVNFENQSSFREVNDSIIADSFAMDYIPIYRQPWGRQKRWQPDLPGMYQRNFNTGTVQIYQSGLQMQVESWVDEPEFTRTTLLDVPEFTYLLQREFCLLEWQGDV